MAFEHEPTLQVIERLEEPSRLRQFMGRIGLVAVLVAGAGACATGDAATAPVGHGEHITAPVRESLSTEPELPVSDETRMRHQQEADKIHFKETVYSFIVWTSAVTPRIPYNSAFWNSLHHCEQADTWHAGGHFGNGLLSGGNGLGMSMGAWRKAVRAAAERGVTLPDTGWGADVNQQMEGAQAYLDKYGWHWQCPMP